MAWYRAYPGMAGHRKLKAVATIVGCDSAHTLQVWNAILEYCSDHGDMTGLDLLDMAEYIGQPLERVTAIFASMKSRGMHDGVTPTTWNEKQYKSDSSTERVQRHRGKVKRSNAVTETELEPPVTPPDTDSESDTDSEKQKEPQLPTEVAPPSPAVREKSRKGTRLADTWEPSPEDLAYADHQGFSAEVPFDGGESPAGQVYMDFRDYFTTGKGRNETNANWDRRAKKWVRDQVKFKPSGGQIAGRSDRPRTSAEALRRDPEFVAAAARLVDAADGGNRTAGQAAAAEGPHGRADGGAGEGGRQVPGRALPKPAGRGGHPELGNHIGVDRMDGVSGAGRTGSEDRRAVDMGLGGSGASGDGRAHPVDQTQGRTRAGGEIARAEAEVGDRRAVSGPARGLHGAGAIGETEAADIERPVVGGSNPGATADRTAASASGGETVPREIRLVETAGAADALDAYEREHGIPQLLHRNVA